MPKITPKQELKDLQKKYDSLLLDARNYVTLVRNPKTLSHSTSPVNIVSADGSPKGRAIVSVEELVSTAKAGDILGFETRIAPRDGGKSLQVEFVEKTVNLRVPDGIVYGGR